MRERWIAAGVGRERPLICFIFQTSSTLRRCSISWRSKGTLSDAATEVSAGPDHGSPLALVPLLVESAAHEGEVHVIQAVAGTDEPAAAWTQFFTAQQLLSRRLPEPQKALLKKGSEGQRRN